MATAEILPPPADRRERLKELETVIAHGWDEVVAVGRALREIRDDGLYLELDGGLTFEQYVRSRWSLARTTAFYRIEAADLHDAVFTIVNTTGVPILTTEVSRELAPVLRKQGPEKVAEAWAKIAARYVGQRPPTAREVNKALVEDGYRERVIGPSSGKVNRAVRLGIFGDKLKAADKRLSYFLERELEGRVLHKRDRETAAAYAELAEAIAARLRHLAAGEVPE